MRVSVFLLTPLLLIAAVAAECAPPDADEVIDLFMAPCCFRGTLKDHHSSEAIDMKAEIRQMISRGETKDEIQSEFVERYGEQILAEPLQKGINRLAFIAPVAVLLAGGAVVLAVLRRNRPAGGRPGPPRRSGTPDATVTPDDELEKMSREED